MANRYSRYELKPYQSMYVDPGKVQVATILKKRYDDNKLNYDMLNRTVGSMQVLEGDEGLKDDMINNINGQFSDIAASGAFEIAGNAVSKATTDFMTNEGLIAARQSYANYDLEKKTKAQLRAQGAQILFDKEFVRDNEGNLVRDENGQPILKEIASMHKSHYQDPRTGEMVTSVYEPKFEQMLGYDEKMADLVANISMSDTGIKQIGALIRTGAYLSNSKVRRVVDGLMGTYLSTDEGIQQMRKLTQLEIDPETGETYTPEKAQEVIKDQMLAIASKQAGKSSFSYQKNPYYVQQQNPGLVATTTTNVQQNNKLLTPGSLFKKNDDGSFKDYEDDGVLEGALIGGNLGSFFGPLGTLAGVGVGSFVDWLIPGKRIFDEKGNYNFKDSNFEAAINECNGDPKCIEQAGEDMMERYDNLVQESGGDIQLMSEAQLFAGRDEYIAKLLVENAEVRQSFDSDKAFLEHITKEMENTQAQVSKIYKGDNEHLKGMNDPKVKPSLLVNRNVHVRKQDGTYTNSLKDAVERLAAVNKDISEKDIYDAIRNGDYYYAGMMAQGHQAGSGIVQINTANGPVQVEIGATNEVKKSFEVANALYAHVTNGYNSPDGQPVGYIDNFQNEYGGITRGFIEYKYDFLRDKEGKVISNSQKGYYPVVTYVYYDKNNNAIGKRTQQEPNKLNELYDASYQSARLLDFDDVPTGG